MDLYKTMTGKLPFESGSQFDQSALPCCSNARQIAPGHGNKDWNVRLACTLAVAFALSLALGPGGVTAMNPVRARTAAFGDAASLRRAEPIRGLKIHAG